MRSGNDDKRSQVGKKKHLRQSKKLLLLTAFVFALIILAVGTYALAFFGQVRETQRILLDDIRSEESYDLEELFPDHIINFALLGFDRGWNREAYGEYLFRPDMLALFSINFDSGDIAVVRIPRDSYVPIHGMGGMHDKINHSYYCGYYYGNNDDRHADGIRFTLKTISNVLGGVPIHYYVSIDMYSVIELVDALGGIYYVSEQNIYDKHWNIGELLVPEGPQIMDGVTFLRYLQYRDDATQQDYGRIDRQMNLLKETFFYLKEQGRINDIPKTYRIYKDYVETDLSYKQIAALALYVRDREITDENLFFHTLTGEGQLKDGIWYLVLFQEKRLAVIMDVFGIEVAAWPTIVLEDSPEYLAEQEKRMLEEQPIEKTLEYEGAFEFKSEPDWIKQVLPDVNEADFSDHVEMIVIPEMWGRRIEDARQVLEDQGFVVGKVFGRHYNYLPEGLVIQSNPLAGSTVKKGSVVNLVVSLGPEKE